jgi:SnoaL-like domain
VSDLDALVHDYVAVWNEPDQEVRRAAVARLWAPGGIHVAPVGRSEGHEAIEQRIAEAYEKWVRQSGFVFRGLDDAVAANDTLRFHWDMAPARGGDAVSVGFDFLVLDDEQRILADYQAIEPASPDPRLVPLVDDYVAVWNEPDPSARRAAVERLWTPDGLHDSPNARAQGWDAIERRIAEAYEQWVAPGTFTFRGLGDASAGTGTLRFHWSMVPAGGGDPVSIGFDFLILGADDKIVADYQSVER